MRFTVREGTDAVAHADGVMLRALGLPSGGIVRLGATHVQVAAGEVRNPTDLIVSPEVIDNAGVTVNESVEVKRAILAPAETIRLDDEILDARHLARALQGRPVSSGDTITIDSGYTEGDDPIELRVLTVEPDGAGLVGSVTKFAVGEGPAVAPAGGATTASTAVRNASTAPRSKRSGPSGGTTRPSAAPGASAPGASARGASAPGASAGTAAPSASSSSATSSGSAARAGAPTPPPEPSGPTTEEALLAGLDNELDMITGWLSLLATNRELANVWKLPAVAGVLLEGPNGCGKSELVNEAAQRADTRVFEVDITKVFKPETLLDKLAAAVNDAVGPRVIFVDRLETLTGDDALSTFRTQFVAVLRWFLDEVASKPKIVCVLGVSDVGALHESIAKSPLLPRTVTIPPPDLNRRRQLFEAAFSAVPHSELDYDRLAALSSGFSGADVLAAVVNASASVAGTGGDLTNDLAVAAVEATSPSLGSVPMGQITGFGFEKVANMADEKQRLTEAVIWPMTQPERFEQLGIDPPKGILLWGPPGTGKTFVVKALAHEAGCAFFAVKGAELLDKYVGESERAVRNVFARARDAAPSIIFFDEFDALAPVRGRSSSGVSDQVVAALLTEIDGVSDRGQVAVIAATNRKDLIDGALLRAGRFESHIEIGLPEKSARLALLNITDVKLDDAVDREELAERTDGLSFADLTGVLREAALAALRADDQAMSVTWDHLETALALFEERRGAIIYE